MLFSIVSERVVLSDGVRPATIVVRDGRIAGIGGYGQRPVGIAVEDFLEHRPVEGEVARLVLGNFAQDVGEPRLVLLGHPPRLGVRVLRRAFLHGGVRKDPVRILVPGGMEAGPHVLELHLLELPLVV